ncbi:MAG: sodium/solute symporter [Verrucomicrobiota bacterium JB022]|nr:sodium/solute symporter [Verrucomicrobiota bacterium JB022]
MLPNITHMLAFAGGDVRMGSLDMVVFVGYLLALVGIGAWVSLRERKTEDYFLGGRSMGWGSIGFSIFGTNIGPTFLIATCGAGYTTGMVTANFEWMAWVFLFLLGMVFVPFYLKTQISTMPEFLSRRFGNGCYSFMTFYSLFGTVVLWIGGTLYAGGALLGQLLGWDTMLSIWVLAGLATVFTVAGGLKAVMVTDSFQSVLIIIGAGALAISGLMNLDSLADLLNVQVRDTPPDLTWKLFHPGDSPTPWYAFVLGYPVLSLWFWCSDQTIVQRALGGKSLAHSQAGTLFCGFLKVLPPFIFLLPGIIAAVLMPGIEDDKEVFLLMVNSYLGPGLKGLIVAVLVAAVVSTLNSGLNSFSTVYTLDIHQRWFSKDQSPRQTRIIGMITTFLAGLMAVGIAAYLKHVQETGGMNLFDLFQSIIGYMAPPVSTVFVLGIFWKRATAKAALTTLIAGSVLCLGLGLTSTLFPGWYQNAEGQTILPHFLLQSFLLFCVLMALMVILSLLTRPSVGEKPLPSLPETYRGQRGLGTKAWIGWGVLAVVMVFLYGTFQLVL